MTDPKLHFIGGVENGVLKLSNRKDFDQALKGFEGKRIEGFIWRQRKRRSNGQNAALWGLAYPILLQGFRDAGHEGVTKEILHEWVKDKFLDPELFDVVSPVTGEIETMRKTTTKLTTTQAMALFDSVQKWGFEFLGVNIPDPDPLWNLND